MSHTRMTWCTYTYCCYYLLLLLLLLFPMDDGYEQAAKTNRPTRVRSVGSVDDDADTHVHGALPLAPFFLSTRAFVPTENE